MRTILLVSLALNLAACSWLPRVHRLTIQQGNVISQEMIDKLKPGMTRRQVAFVMGEPVIRHPFNADRWDYVYTILVPDVGSQKLRMSLFFENDQLSYFAGDLAPSATTPDKEEPDAAEASATDGSSSQGRVAGAPPSGR